MTRQEDLRLLTGRGCYSDDVNLPGQLYLFVLRSPHAHADIGRIDTAQAAKAPGIVKILTGADYLAEGLGGIPNVPNPPDRPLKNVDGPDVFETPIFPIVTDKVRRAGEAVAVVVAESLAEAKDGAELIEIDYIPLPAMTTPEAATAEDAPAIWNEVPGNVFCDDRFGDRDAADAAFAAAEHVAEIDLHNNRVYGHPMEPRAAVGEWHHDENGLSLFAGGQGIVIQRFALRDLFGVEEESVRVVCRDVGGGFGTRALTFPEFVFTLWASKHVNRPVKWTGERSEIFLSDPQARDMKTHAEMALDKDGKFLAMRAYTVSNIGCQTLHLVPEARGIPVTTGLYDIPVADVSMKVVFTNTVPTCVYRGAGRPEAINVIERLVEKAAQVTGIDRFELRRRNFIEPGQIPYLNAVGTNYDSGEFQANMDAALKIAEIEKLSARRDEAKSRGKLLGVGCGNYIETATGIPPERTIVDIQPDGRVHVIIGTQTSGQGHETSFSQLIVDLLGVPYTSINVHEGDTNFVKFGFGSHSSRSMRVGGTLLHRAAHNLIERGKEIAGHVLEAGTTDIEFADGAFNVAGTDRGLTLFEVAREARDNEGLPEALRGKFEEMQQTTEMIPTYPNGCHVVEVEIDIETGEIDYVRHSGVDDVGIVINPLLVDGQTHGAIVQGVGQALLENSVYDEQTGQLIAGSLMDYCLPRADDMPFFDVETNEVRAPNNPFGIKGAGEGGTTGSPPAVINAVVDALSDYGVTHVDMPATPEKIWRAIHGPAAT